MSNPAENPTLTIRRDVEKTLRDFVEIKGFEGILPVAGLFKIHALKLDAGYITPRRKAVARWIDSNGAERCEPMTDKRVVRGEPTAAEPRGAVLHHTAPPNDTAQVIQVKHRGGSVRDPIGDVEMWRLSIDCKLRNLEPGERKLLTGFAALTIGAKLTRDGLKRLDEVLASATECRRLGPSGTALLRERRGRLRRRQDRISTARRRIANSDSYANAVINFAITCSRDSQTREYCMVTSSR